MSGPGPSPQLCRQPWHLCPFSQGHLVSSPLLLNCVLQPDLPVVQHCGSVALVCWPLGAGPVKTSFQATVCYAVNLDTVRPLLPSPPKGASQCSDAQAAGGVRSLGPEFPLFLPPSCHRASLGSSARLSSCVSEELEVHTFYQSHFQRIPDPTARTAPHCPLGTWPVSRAQACVAERRGSRRQSSLVHYPGSRTRRVSVQRSGPEWGCQRAVAQTDTALCLPTVRRGGGLGRQPHHLRGT